MESGDQTKLVLELGFELAFVQGCAFNFFAVFVSSNCSELAN